MQTCCRWTLLMSPLRVTMTRRKVSSSTRVMKDLTCLSSQSLLFPHDDRVMSVIEDSMLIYEDFISEVEEKNLLQELEVTLKKIRYEKSHWDKVRTSSIDSKNTQLLFFFLVIRQEFDTRCF